MALLPKIKHFVWSRRFLKNFAILIGVYIVLFFGLKVFLAWKTNHGQKIEVPDLIGKNVNNMEHLIDGTGFRYEVLDSIYDPSKIAGTIIEQDPLPTKDSKIYVKEGRKIKVRVTKRMQLVEMPDLVSKSQRFAEGVLRNRGFRYRVEYTPSREAHGAVLQQYYGGKKIAPGKKIPIGSTIRMIVGRNEVGTPQELPNLTGMTILEARNLVSSLMNIDFILTCPDCTTSADSLSARVQSQSPEFTDGAIILSGGVVTVYASKSTQTP